MKKKVYIVSHSHWDREWYLPYEKHHMRLVELIDDLLELIESDPNFNSFHLDGQTIILDDYLQVRPEKKGELESAIQHGKLRIGPFYILQDDFLISSESNVRNMLIGHEECKKWGTPVKLGYFPDTFGNMGQTPQMMQKAGLSSAAFGRGVKPIGFDNQVLESENYTSQYSEMWWEGPDNSKIFGLLFANWYSNGNEIPTEEQSAKEFWNQKLKDAEKYASTNHLLMMNGVDHQPVQKDITKAIALANELFEEYEFIHSNFDDYLSAVTSDVPESLATVSGELTSQETDGWYTLANTASSRAYLKQWNTKVQRQLENVSEPLVSMAYELTGKYPHDQMDYAWKTLLQNHPHDSICGCSVDEVHREMMTRFEKSYEVGDYLAKEALTQLGDSIDTTGFSEEAKLFTLFNTAGFEKKDIVELDVRLERKLFSQGKPEFLYEELEKQEKFSYQITDTIGNIVPSIISEEKVRFDYDLPKDSFRVPFMEKYVTVKIYPTLAPLSWETFALTKSNSQKESIDQSMITNNGRKIESNLVEVTIHLDGTLDITDKKTKKSVKNILTYEDTGDIGNEYIYFAPKGETPIFSNAKNSEVSILLDTEEIAQIKLTQKMMIPVSADNHLIKEQQKVVEFKERTAQRSNNTEELVIETVITVMKDSPRIEFQTNLDNQMKDHRLRVLFPTNIIAKTHEADSIFEVVTRSNKVSSNWENPTNAQHQHAFVNLHDESHGVTISNYGLNEYEILNSKTIALTLFRAVGEMGDWGYFPTLEAQCIGNMSFNFGIELHGNPQERYETYKRAYSAQIPFSSVCISKHSGSLPAKGTYLEAKSDTFALTCLKRNKKNELVLRGYNMSNQQEDIYISKTNQKQFPLNLLEEQEKGTVQNKLVPFEIYTIGFSE